MSRDSCLVIHVAMDAKDTKGAAGGRMRTSSTSSIKRDSIGIGGLDSPGGM